MNESDIVPESGSIKSRRFVPAEVFISPSIPESRITHFGLTEEKIQKAFDEAKKFGHFLSINPVESINFLRFPNNQFAENERFSILKSLLNGYGRTFKNIGSFDITDKILDALPENLEYEKIESKVIPSAKKKEVEGFLFEELLYDVEFEDKWIKDVNAKTLMMWERDMGAGVVSSKPSTNIEVYYEKKAMLEKNKVYQEMIEQGITATKALADKLEHKIDARFPPEITIDEQIRKEIKEGAKNSGTAAYWCDGKFEGARPWYFQIALLLSPYLAEVNTTEDYFKYGFCKDVPQDVLDKAIYACGKIRTTYLQEIGRK